MVGGGGRCSGGSEYHLALLHTAVAGTMRGGGGGGGERCSGGSEYHLALLHTAVAGTMRGGGGGGDVAVGVSIIWHCYTQL